MFAPEFIVSDGTLVTSEKKLSTLQTRSSYDHQT